MGWAVFVVVGIIATTGIFGLLALIGWAVFYVVFCLVMEHLFGPRRR